MIFQRYAFIFLSLLISVNAFSAFLPTNFTDAERVNKNVWTKVRFTFVAPSTGMTTVSLRTSNLDDQRNDMALDDISLINGASGTFNLIKNGDFRKGIEGFQTDYANVSQVTRHGQVAIVTSPPDWGMPNKTGRTGSGDAFMMIDGHKDENKAFWRQEINLEQGSTYEFSAYMTINEGTASPIIFSVGGKDIGDAYDLKFINPINTTVLTDFEIRSVVTERSQWKAKMNVWGGDIRHQALVGNWPSGSSAQLSEKWNFHLMSDGRFTIRPSFNTNLCVTPNWVKPGKREIGQIWLATDVCNMNPYSYFFLQKSNVFGMDAFVIRNAYQPELCVHSPGWPLWYDRNPLLLSPCAKQSDLNFIGNDRFIIDNISTDKIVRNRMQEFLNDTVDKFAFSDVRDMYTKKSPHMWLAKGDRDLLQETTKSPRRVPMEGVYGTETVFTNNTSSPQSNAEWRVKSITKTTAETLSFGHTFSIGLEVMAGVVGVSSATLKAGYEFTFGESYTTTYSNTEGSTVIKTVNIPPYSTVWLARGIVESTYKISGWLYNDLGDSWQARAIQMDVIKDGDLVICQTPVEKGQTQNEICKQTMP